MKRVFLALLVVGLMAVSAAAIEVRLHDGTVVEATSYTLTELSDIAFNDVTVFLDDHDVLDPSDRCTAGIEQREAHHPERVDQVTGHGRRLLTTTDSADVTAVVDERSSHRFDLDQGVAVGDAASVFDRQRDRCTGSPPLM